MHTHRHRLPRLPRLSRLVPATTAAGAVVLAGCSPAPAPPPARTPQAIEALRPGDARLAATYERSCFLCHARPGSGAPTVGDAAAWRPRLAKGADALVASVANGLGGMPPRGLCADCSDADLRALIAFMSTEAAR